MKYYCVSIDGIDKAGKGIIIKYLAKISNYTLNIFDRGIITNIVWNKMLDRNIDYELDFWKNTLFVRLNVDKEDWKIRCAINNEPEMPISYEEMTKMYNDEFDRFKEMGFNMMSINTSEMTPYIAAKEIYRVLLEMNNSENS